MKFANYKFNARGVNNLGDNMQLIAIDSIYERMGIPKEDIIYIDKNDNNILYAEKDGRLFKTDGMGDPTVDVNIFGDYSINGLVDDNDLPSDRFHYERRGMQDIRQSFGVKGIEPTVETVDEMFGINEEQVKLARRALNKRGLNEGMTKKEAVQILIKHNIR